MNPDSSLNSEKKAVESASPSRRNVLLAAGGLSACALGAAGGYWWTNRSPSGASGATGATKHEAAKLLNAQFVGLDGETNAINRWRGKTLLVNFWATWCGPCREEMPDFVRAQSDFGGKGLQIVGLAVDRKEPVQRFVKELAINYPILMADVAWLEEVKTMGNPQGVLPYSVVFGPNGDVILNRVGKIKYSEIVTIMS
jgi:thiol-disulfide isomerase/thioredoxin